jgi:hypothetical protein
MRGINPLTIHSMRLDRSGSSGLRIAPSGDTELTEHTIGIGLRSYRTARPSACKLGNNTTVGVLRRQLRCAAINMAQP